MEFKRIQDAYLSIEKKIPYKPHIAIILGSGLGGFADGLKPDAVIPYNDIKGFPVSTVHGHKGRFVFARANGVPVMLMQGRVHFYEGYTMQEVVLPVRIMRMAGAEKLLVTNAAGGINPAFETGTFMIIRDHINMAPNPLIGENINQIGIRFPDMTEAYDKKLIAALDAAGKEAGLSLPQGVYTQLTGPSFETPAEIKMLSVLGADAVGMSTACEVIAANHAGMRVCGISCISNAAAGLTAQKLSHEDVNAATELVKDKLSALMLSAISHIDRA